MDSNAEDPAARTTIKLSIERLKFIGLLLIKGSKDRTHQDQIIHPAAGPFPPWYFSLHVISTGTGFKNVGH